MTKAIIFLVVITLLKVNINAQSGGGVVISNKPGQSPHQSAILDLNSDNKGFILPNISGNNQVDNPAEALIIFNTVTSCFEIFLEAEWHDIWCLDGCVASTDPTGITGNNEICEGTDTDLAVQGGSLGTEASWIWYTDGCGDGDGGVYVDEGTTINISPSGTTTYYVRAEGTCGITDCEEIEVSVSSASLAGSISEEHTVCTGNQPDDLTLSGYNGEIEWQYSNDGSSNWTLIAGATSNVLSGSQMGELFDDRWYRAVVTNSPCESQTSAPVVISVEDAAPTPTAGVINVGEDFVEWNWNPSDGADGYYINTIDDYDSAHDYGNNTSFTQETLPCETTFNLYVWAYNDCGVGSPLVMTAETDDCPPLDCPASVEYGGYEYSTVQIGNQCWFAENLRYNKNDCLDATWVNHSYEGWCGVYDHFSFTDTDTIFGLLYQWELALEVCPDGWKLPTMNEYITLIRNVCNDAGHTNCETEFLYDPFEEPPFWPGTDEGSRLAGGWSHWDDGDLRNNPNFGSTGFNALPGGRVTENGTYTSKGINSFLWTSNLIEVDGEPTRAWRTNIGIWYSEISYGGTSPFRGYNVRCVKE